MSDRADSLTSPQKATNPENIAQKATILIVDDEASNRKLIRSYLQPEYDILEAEDAPEALRALESAKIDLILLDVLMPGMSGFEACRLFKEKAGSRFLPVLLITALSNQEDRNAGLEAGADDFLQKPVNPRELELRVRTFLKLRQQEQVILQNLENIQQLVALKEDLISLILHDLRNPLTGVLGFLGILEKELQNSPLLEDVQYALKEAVKMRDLLEDIRQVSQLEQGTYPLRFEEESLLSVLQSAAHQIEESAREKGVKIKLDAPRDFRLSLDLRLITRALENLVRNALRYSRRGGEVEITMYHQKEGVVIEIGDRGPSIPDTLQQSLFEKFVAKNLPRRGSGMELYLVKLVAAAHQGRISLRNREGGGLIFCFFLPEAKA